MEIAQSIIKVDDGQLISLINSAQRRIAFLGPGISEPVVNAIKEKWQQLGKENVMIVLDLDPEVFRLGYGEFKAFQHLQDFAQSFGANIRQQNGIRIGILIIDDSALIYAPTPKLIEAGATNTFQPNAIFLFYVPESLLVEIGWGAIPAEKQTVGNKPVSEMDIKGIERNLDSNPPVSFDIARQVNVFNSQFEFVDLEIHGCNIERKTITIPQRLLALVSDKDTRERMRATYKVVSDDSKISGDSIIWARKELVDPWLTTLPGYGQIVLRSNKENLNKGIADLKKEIDEYKKTTAEKLQNEINSNCDSLYNVLLPALIIKPPQEWLDQMGHFANEEGIKSRLRREIKSLLGDAKGYFSEMNIKILFKAVTYEMLTDPKFIATTRKALPDLPYLYKEYQAAPMGQPDLFN